MGIVCLVVVAGGGRGRLTYDVVPRSGEHTLVPNSGECRVDRVVHVPIEANKPERVILFVSKTGD